jgi:hypothetical protein
MNERIIDFVRSCPKCQKNKATRYQPYRLSSPLELPYAPWQSIAMDFITDLPVSSKCDQLWMVIDRFTKMAHFIPLPKEGKTAADLSIMFAQEVWRYHGLPTDIVSDRDSRFTSEVWKEFLGQMGTRPRMSTAFHPQTDGQTERLNQTIEAYLRAFVSKEQDDWVRLLPMAEFAYNNSNTSGNGMSPFYANYGFHPRTIDPPGEKEERINPASQVYAHWMRAVHDESRKGLEEAQERMRRYSDPKRKEPPAYHVGDLVMLNGRNIKTRRPSKKLDHKNHGPFQVEKIISPLAVRLTLPRQRSITSSTYSYSNPIELANTGPRQIQPRSCEKQMTSNNQKSTMWTRSLGASKKNAASCTSLNGSTIRNARIGRKSPSTTFR